MEQNKSNNRQESSDEIDLGLLSKMLNNLFQRLFNGILRIFIYLRRRAVIIGVIGLVGVLIGYGLKQFVEKQVKLEVIVRPNADSKNYLYDAIEEIQANLRSRDQAFFKNLGFEKGLEGLEISIERIKETEQSEAEKEYLEMLMSFENSAIISDVVRAEVLNNTSFNHKIIFYYQETGKGKEFAKAILDYLNSNSYYKNLTALEIENAEMRIDQNQVLIQQIDTLIDNYSKNLGKGASYAGGQITLDNEKPLDLPGLITLKNNLIRDIEIKKVELIEKSQPIKVINFGNPQTAQKPFFGKKVVLIPMILLGLFFLVEIIVYLDRKAKLLR